MKGGDGGLKLKQSRRDSDSNSSKHNKTRDAVPSAPLDLSISSKSGFLHQRSGQYGAVRHEKHHDEEQQQHPGDELQTVPIPRLASAWQARCLLLVASALYGSNYTFVKLLENSLEPCTAAALRFTIAAIVFAPALRGSTKKVLRDGAEVGFWHALGYCAQSVALTTTTASKSAFICSLAVVFVLILDSLFARPPQTPFDGPLAETLSPASPPLPPPLPPPLAIRGLPHFWPWLASRAWSSAALSPPALATRGRLRSLCASAWGSGAWHRVGGALLYTGLVSTAVTTGMETVALESLTAAESTVIFSTEPLWGAAVAVALLGETTGLNTAAGAALILCACLWSTIAPQAVVRGAAIGGGLVGTAALLDNAAQSAARAAAAVGELLSELMYIKLP
ncbi:hypothetical protein JKP88DRAFT_261317 [Tribonema minus]|uniref:EamA domain-containing protein n=1 Tax=Tribonema minus TaxID=303371 RepID=A0A835YNJ2_9STRA|nr:hypothetical protein JKP88DRAFT_261317 [Tribonema minus]